MHNVYLCHVNNLYGNQAFLPYTAGVLQAYCESIPEIADSFDFKRILYLRENPKHVVQRLNNPKVFGISCYVWNWEYNMALARQIKSKYPECLIVLGGPHVPLRDTTGFFTEYPYVDFLIHGEGEITFSEILIECLAKRPDFRKIHGLSIHTKNQQTYRTQKRERLKDFSILPSPYTWGVFDEIVRTDPYVFQASQETNRGCPYSCAYCDWGSATMTRIRTFSDERVEAEFEWFGRNKIEFVFNCDANFGLMPRDLELTRKLLQTKAKYGYPRKYKASFAKNSTPKLFSIAKLLNDSGMSKGVTLSFQSMNDNTLDAIKRSNIKITDFEKLIYMYRSEGIPTFSELIMGLPGETYDSFSDALDQLMRAGQHDSMFINTCYVLPNTLLNDPIYREKHGIQTVRNRSSLNHSTPNPGSITEYDDMVIATKTMPEEDWKRTYLFAWASQCFHALNLTQYLAVFLYDKFGLSFRTFYQRLIEFIQNRPDSIAGKQYHATSEIVDQAMRGGSLEWINPSFGNIIWTPDEGAFLNMVVEKNMFYREVGQFLRQLTAEFDLNLSNELLSDLLCYQSHLVVDPYSPQNFSFETRHNLHDYFINLYEGDRVPLLEVSTVLEVKADKAYAGDLESYAREIIWFGRKGGRMRHSNVTSSAGNTLALSSNRGPSIL